MYSPAGSRSRELTSLRLMKSSERALEACVRKKSRLRWTPDLPTIWDGRRRAGLQGTHTRCLAGLSSFASTTGIKEFRQTYLTRHLLKTKRQRQNSDSVTGLGTTAGHEEKERNYVGQRPWKTLPALLLSCSGNLQSVWKAPPKIPNKFNDVLIWSSTNIRLLFSAHKQPPLI